MRYGLSGRCDVNYSELVAAIESTTENTFETTDVNRFIRAAERRVYMSIDFVASVRNATSTLTSGDRFLRCPDDCLSVQAMTVVAANGAHTHLLPKDVSFIREAYPNPTDVGTPKYYALFGPQSDDPTVLTFIFGPTPNEALGVELHYMAFPASIVTESTSWLGTNMEEALLYAALIEAYIFMKGEADVLAMYEARFKEALMLSKRVGDGLQRSDMNRNGTPRVAVS